MNREAWNEIAASFRDKFHILIILAVFGFVAGASIAILERMEKSRLVVTPTPSIRSFTRTKEIEVTVTQKENGKRPVEQPKKTFRSYSPESPKRLNSPYSPQPIRSSPVLVPQPTRRTSTPKTTEKETTEQTYSPNPTEPPKPTSEPSPEPEVPEGTNDPNEGTIEQPSNGPNPPVGDPSSDGG